MAITVTMIEEKEFKTKVRGYDPVEVDEFLDEICDEMIEMQGTIQTLRDQLKLVRLYLDAGDCADGDDGLGNFCPHGSVHFAFLSAQVVGQPAV